MPYAVLEKEIERLDETQQNTIVLFVCERIQWLSRGASAMNGKRYLLDTNAVLYMRQISKGV